jgi:RNA-directed DNA polymerase
MKEGKSFEISQQQVLEAYKRVKANHGAAGIDGITFEAYEKDLKNNLYKLWNRMSSGTYFPKPVKGVEIPKKNGKIRLLGVPTVSDRVAQMVVQMNFEPLVEPIFHENSYGIDLTGQQSMQSGPHVKDAGTCHGYWSSTSSDCSTT